VKPNPDGSKARCGGPSLCAVCAQERSEAHDAALDAEWNAAIEAAAEQMDAVMPYPSAMDRLQAAAYLKRRLLALKREVKP